jgi:hypothetical protein
MNVNPLKPKEKKRERRKKVGWVVRDTTFNGGGGEIIFKNSVRTSKRTLHFTITVIISLTLFK